MEGGRSYAVGKSEIWRPGFAREKVPATFPAPALLAEDYCAPLIAIVLSTPLSTLARARQGSSILPLVRMMATSLTFDKPIVAIASRTLLLAGYEIEGGLRQPTHIEISCHKTSVLRARINYLVAITEGDEFGNSVVGQLRDLAARQGRALVLVATQGGAEQLGWSDFLEALGGAVPTWRALTPDCRDNMETAARNKLPAGFEGEAWRLFEDLVADGLEFVFGRKVRRLGARKRGQRLSDMITQIPDGAILVIDAKATGSAFNATVSELRPLIEYTKAQQRRQSGHNEVFAALIVAPEFDQNATLLAGTSREFLAEAAVPAAFVTASTLSEIVASLAAQPSARNAIHWRRLLAGGLLAFKEFAVELERVNAERYSRG